ncbi:MAG TPA: roadblock/LC7 domain-containing protein [Thermoanaerobaculia bacterium]|jgi:predicted regulator of Ras-like GTPase activity (Roadblock/LC7/MglB family)|nr:roadblock/LC7 domain-containing protein [Thermoanaerobaculia bacterium]
MSPADLVLYDEDFRKLQQTLRRLRHESDATFVLLVDKNGQRIASVGDVDALDVTALASLTAGNVAATDGLARILGEREFSVLLHEGEKENIHLSIVAGKVILVVIFEDRSSLGLVRLRVRQATAELAEAFREIAERMQREPVLHSSIEPLLAEITDEDIDRLFSE